MKKNRKSLAWVSIGVFAVVAALLVGACTWVRKSAEKTYRKNIGLAPFDVIIVPGIPFDTALSGNGAILLKSRMMWSKYLYETGICKNIIYSGSAVHTPFQEGKMMKMIADSLGIPPERTFIEGRALHSNENVIYGLDMARKMGFHNVAVATDPFQSLFIKRFVLSNKMKVALLPLSVDSMPVYNNVELPEVEYEDAFVEDFIPLKKRKR